MVTDAPGEKEKGGQNGEKKGGGKNGTASPEPRKQTQTPRVTHKKEEHENIYQALSAFQGENIKLSRTKKVTIKSDKGEDKSYEFWYAPLDEILDLVRPLLAKHGLSFVHTEHGQPTTAGNRQMVCELYHETYERKKVGEKVTESNIEVGSLGSSKTGVKTTEPVMEEVNVIRSMPIVVTRSGKMKDVGSDSTYARRYTLGEVLGIAPEDDNDVEGERERVENLEKTAFRMAMQRVENAKDHAALTQQVEALEKDLKAIEDGKTPSLGFDKDELSKLMDAAAKRRTKLGKPKDAAGDNKDGGGTNTIT